LLRADAPPDRTVLSAFDEQLVEHGSVIHQSRLDGLAALESIARDRFAAIMPTAESFSVGLKSGVPDTQDDFREGFARALERSYARDRARGMTNVGPHRGDLLLQLGEREARVFASQGQQRAMVLALKLAEVASLAERLGTAPILLLDDVSSELDAERTRLLFAALAETGCQLWVSTTGAVELPLPEDAQILELVEGRLH
jgi:DNA replication and repair protein RecF